MLFVRLNFDRHFALHVLVILKIGRPSTCQSGQVARLFLLSPRLQVVLTSCPRLNLVCFVEQAVNGQVDRDVNGTLSNAVR